MTAVATASGVSGIAIMAYLAGIATGFLIAVIALRRSSPEPEETDPVGMGETPRSNMTRRA